MQAGFSVLPGGTPGEALSTGGMEKPACIRPWRSGFAHHCVVFSDAEVLVHDLPLKSVKQMFTCTSSSGPMRDPVHFSPPVLCSYFSNENRPCMLEVKGVCTCWCARVAVQQKQPGVLEAADRIRNSMFGGQRLLVRLDRGDTGGRGGQRPAAACTPPDFITLPLQSPMGDLFHHQRQSYTEQVQMWRAEMKRTKMGRLIASRQPAQKRPSCVNGRDYCKQKKQQPK